MKLVAIAVGGLAVLLLVAVGFAVLNATEPAQPGGTHESSFYYLTATVRAPRCDVPGDIAGAPVKVLSDTGQVLSTTTTTGALPNTRPCTVSFGAYVPTEAAYRVDIGHQRQLSYSFEQLQRDGFHVEIDLQ